MDDLLDTFCDIDDFYKIFIPEWEGVNKQWRDKKTKNQAHEQ